jgi:UDP-N-acetylglucosamine 2-epimerase
MNLLATADAMVGNSSAGIVEAPFFKLPIVNIGIRQHGREHGNNVITVGHNENEIVRAIRKTLRKEFYQKISKNPYQIKGRTEKNIADILSKIPIDSKLLSKQPIY